MYKIRTLNEIASEGLSRLDESIQLSQDTEVDAYVVRSFNLHDHPFPDSLLAIARAGVGVNTIPIDACSEKGIVVFNAIRIGSRCVKDHNSFF